MKIFHSDPRSPSRKPYVPLNPASGRPVRASTPWVIAQVVAFALALAGTAFAVADLRLGEHGFDWTTVEQDRAHFRWTAEVINDTTQDVEVEVTVDLLDDDDAVIASDSTSATLAAGQRARVEHDGSLPFDRAADVVSFRFRLDPGPPDRGFRKEFVRTAN